MPGIEDTEQIQYEKLSELQKKNEELAQQLKQKIKLVGKYSHQTMQPNNLCDE